MHVRFWGTRGSLAKPGYTTLRYGGNTSCVELRAPDGTLIVLDCGTGAHDLGRHLLEAGGEASRGHILITHTHWDHIQGFPFFAPLFVEAGAWDIHAPHMAGQGLENTLGRQMEYTFFPVGIDKLRAAVRYRGLIEGSFDLGGVTVTTRYLNHPGLALGYRLEAGGVTVVYATDHEPHSRHHPEPCAADQAGGVSRCHPEDDRHIEFLAGADLVIHDAQYTLEEYPGKLTWGHTPAELAVDFALAGGVKRLALFHHDPLRHDDAVDRLVERCQDRVAAAGGALEVLAAAEGQGLTLGSQGGAAARPVRARGPDAVVVAGAGATRGSTVLLVDDDPDVLDVLTATLEPEGFHLLSARDGEAALRMARAQRPDLLLLDWSLPGRDGLAVCRALREEADPRLSRVPVVLLTGYSDAQDTAAGFAAGVTDYIAKPFKPTHVRARVHAWLLRSRAGQGGHE